MLQNKTHVHEKGNNKKYQRSAIIKGKSLDLARRGKREHNKQTLSTATSFLLAKQFEIIAFNSINAHHSKPPSASTITTAHIRYGGIPMQNEEDYKDANVLDTSVY